MRPVESGPSLPRRTGRQPSKLTAVVYKNGDYIEVSGQSTMLEPRIKKHYLGTGRGCSVGEQGSVPSTSYGYVRVSRGMDFEFIGLARRKDGYAKPSISQVSRQRCCNRGLSASTKSKPTYRDHGNPGCAGPEQAPASRQRFARP